MKTTSQSFWRHTLDQGRNEVYFFVTDPIFLPKILNPDPKNGENLDPWTRKTWNLIPDPSFHEKYCWSRSHALCWSRSHTLCWSRSHALCWSRSHALWFQIPGLWSLSPALFRPLIRDPIYLVTTMLDKCHRRTSSHLIGSFRLIGH